MRSVVVMVLASALLTSTASATETVRYVALVNGGTTKAGHQSVTRNGNKVRVDFIFKDNGRGPELKEEFTLGEDGTFVRYHVAGTSTFGSAVNETFTRKGDKVSWKSLSDKGEQSVQGTAFYSPLGGTPAAMSVAFAALAKRVDGKLPMIPGGTLTSRKLLETEVSRGSDTRKVQLIALTGIGFTPITAWITADEAPRLFAYIFPGYLQLIEEGWESNGAALENQQKAAEEDLLVAYQKRLAHPLASTTLIRNARVFDSENATLGSASDVLLDNGRIISISPAGADALTLLRTPGRGEGRKADHVVDAAGRVLLPGLFDMHVHMSFWDGGLHLASGITTVREMGNDNQTMLQLLEREKAGTLLAPRVVLAGFIEGESPMSARSGFVVKNLDDAKRAVDWYHEHGYPQIKIYNSFPRDILPDVTAYAHAKGLRVGGHVPAFMRAEEVVLAGYDELQHINQVMLNFLVDDKTDTRTLQRFYLPAEKVAYLDFDSKRVTDFIALLAQRKIVVDPTLATFDFVRQRDGELSKAYAAVADHVPPDVRRGFHQAQMKIPDAATAERYEKSYEKMVEFTGRMYRAGVPLVAGTDGLPGFTLQRELELYVQAGLTPSEVLQIATYNGARYARVLDDRGVILPGKRADLILVDGDPTQNISDIRKVALVIKGDMAYYPSEIHEALGVTPFTEPLAVN